MAGKKKTDRKENRKSDDESARPTPGAAEGDVATIDADLKEKDEKERNESQED